MRPPPITAFMSGIRTRAARVMDSHAVIRRSILRKMYVTIAGIKRIFYTSKSQYRILKQNFLEKELRGQSPNFHIHVSVSDLYIPTIDLPILWQENMWTDPGNI